MKILTILGTRPEIIRLSRVIPVLDQRSTHIVVHTGQNYDERLSGIFFRELRLREPDEFMGVRAASFGEQVGQILGRVEALLLKHRPDRVLVLGDTNSGLVAIIARRLGIPVYHMEAGNRCFDDRVPEEVNRRVIDHASSVLLPYTERSRENLLREGFASNRIYVTGNPIKEVLDFYSDDIAKSACVEQLGLEPKKYFLATIHRAENVDRRESLSDLMVAFQRLHERDGMPVVCSLHPRTRARLGEFGLERPAGVQFVEPLGFFDFVRLEREAYCLLSDSGTVQEEGCIFGVPNVTLRNVTERPETVECGSNYIAGTRPAAIVDAVEQVIAGRGSWLAPREYLQPNVAETVARIVLGYRIPDPAELEWRSRNSDV